MESVRLRLLRSVRVFGKKNDSESISFFVLIVRHQGKKSDLFFQKKKLKIQPSFLLGGKDKNRHPKRKWLPEATIIKK